MTDERVTITVDGQTITIGPVLAIGAGEANTGANVGVGAGVFRDKTGVALNLRTIRGVGGIVTTVNGDQVDVDGSALAGTRSAFYPANFDANLGDMLSLRIGSAGSGRFNFQTPADFANLTSLALIGQPSGTNATADIDLGSDYGALGEASSNHSETDTAITFDLTSGQLEALDISNVFSSLAAGDFAGITVQHQTIGFDMDYLGILLTYAQA